MKIIAYYYYHTLNLHWRVWRKQNISYTYSNYDTEQSAVDLHCCIWVFQINVVFHNVQNHDNPVKDKLSSGFCYHERDTTGFWNLNLYQSFRMSFSILHCVHCVRDYYWLWSPGRYRMCFINSKLLNSMKQIDFY